MTSSQLKRSILHTMLIQELISDSLPKTGLIFGFGKKFAFISLWTKRPSLLDFLLFSFATRQNGFGKKFAFISLWTKRPSLLDFLLFSFATRQNDFRHPRTEFGPIHRSKIATF